MSEFIKCDGCGRMAKKDLINGPREWSTIEITTHRNNGLFGEDPSTYHVCPECRKEIMKTLAFRGIDDAGARRL